MSGLDPKLRRILMWAGVGVGILLLNFVVMGALPSGQPAPIGVLLLAAYNGLFVGLLAAGIVLVYRSIRFINFAAIAMGGIGTAVFFHSTRRGFLPYFVALPVGLLIGVIVGIALGVLMVTLFFRHPRLVLTIASILIAQQLVSLERSIAGNFQEVGDPTQQQTLPVPFGWDVEITAIPFNFGHIVGFVLGIASLVGLAMFLKKTRFGIAVRGAAENADRASLLGINVKLVQIGVWAIVGLFGAMNAVFQVPAVGYAAGQGAEWDLMILPLAAAVLARMSSLPVAVAGGFAMVIVDQIFKWSCVFSICQYSELVLFAIILVGLFVQKEIVRSRSAEGGGWRAIKEIRPTPRELDSMPMIGWSRRVLLAVVGVLALAFPWIAEPGQTQAGGELMIYAMVGLSIVVLTGWAGQITLGQFAFVTIGAVAAGVVSGKWGWPFWIALPIGAGLTAAFAVLVGLPALRIRGLFLAVTTFSLAIVVPSVLFGEALSPLLIPEQVRRPNLLFFKFADERSFYYLILLTFVGVFMMTRSLRRSRTGRVLIAIREDEAGAQSFGINVVRTRLSAFALSGAIAGFAGVLLAHHQTGVDQTTYGLDASLQHFIAAIVGGLGALSGPVFGEMFFTLTTLLGDPWTNLIQGSFPIIVVMFIPGGIAQIVYGVRDGILRVVALRRHIVVPSLFADYSPDAWEKRLAPLAPPLPNRGLAALPPERRYSLSSRLFGRTPTAEKVN